MVGDDCRREDAWLNPEETRCMFIKRKVLGAEAIWGSLMSNIIHLLMLIIIFNVALVLPKTAWKHTAEPRGLDEHGPGVGGKFWGCQERPVVGHEGFGAGCGPWKCPCFAGTEMPPGRCSPSWKQLMTGKKLYVKHFPREGIGHS